MSGAAAKSVLSPLSNMSPTFCRTYVCSYCWQKTKAKKGGAITLAGGLYYAAVIVAAIHVVISGIVYI